MVPIAVLAVVVFLFFIFFILFIHSAFVDMAEKNKLLSKQIVNLNKDVADSKKAVQFGIDMAAARIEKLSKLQPMAALEELRAENERNQRLKNAT